MRLGGPRHRRGERAHGRRGGALARRARVHRPEREIAGPVLAEVESRLRFLERVDVGYLTLDRATRTLSGGEAQRIELANALGANLADTLYVLDEPTVGLHPRDTDRLVAILRELADAREHAGRGRARAAGHARGRPRRGPRARAPASSAGTCSTPGPAARRSRASATETARYLRGEKRVERARRAGRAARTSSRCWAPRTTTSRTWTRASRWGGSPR